MRRILVVEDEAAVRENIVEFLRAEGYETVEARDGEEGVRAVFDELPDLIICDIRMPRLDGFGMLARLSQDPAAANIPFIFLTARTERADQRAGMTMGADDYITKPFIRSDLLASVRRRLDKRKQIDEMAEQKINDLRSKIDNEMPYELLAPAGILLGHSETLMKAEWISSDPSQVRSLAREMNRAASRLVHQVQTYLLYADLEAAAVDPQRMETFHQQRTPDGGEILVLLAASVAQGFGRKPDLVVDAEPASFRVPETLFQTIVEEFVDRAFRQSRHGTPVQVQGLRRTDAVYLITVSNQGGRIPPQLISARSGGYDANSSPVGLRLVERILSLVGGQLRIEGDLNRNWAEIELPIV